MGRGFAKKKKGKKKKLSPEEALLAQELKATQDQYMMQKGELDHEQGARSYFQLERDKINAFWEIAKKDLESLKAELRNKKREFEEDKERHSVELKVYKQKVRHLLYEHKITLDRLKIENENAIKMQQDEQRQKINQYVADRRKLQSVLREKQLENSEMIKALRMEQEKELTEIRNSFERELKQIQLRYQAKMKELREDMEEASRSRVRKIEQEKNNQIRELMNKHQKEFSDIKRYYKGITDNNLALVKKLNHQVSMMKKSEATNEKLMFEIAQSNKNLSEPLMKKLGEVNALRKNLANYQKDKLKLKNAKARLMLVEGELKNVKWEHEILLQSYEAKEKLRDDLITSYETSIYEAQQKTLLKNQLLQTKAKALREAISRKDDQLREVLRLATEKPTH
mmetsp:Transcript_8802/g.13052  ORF Transcript_8802/g.13052 Transcript_8802/m.13052 type:complete len:398 (+) Transcript_8802:119-1312(+)